MAAVSARVLQRRVRRRTSPRRQPVDVGLPPVRLVAADRRRRRDDHVPHPRPHPTLLPVSGQCQLARETRKIHEISDRHRLQREQTFLVEVYVPR